MQIINYSGINNLNIFAFEWKILYNKFKFKKSTNKKRENENNVDKSLLP